jgi:hypothetical protein
MKKLVWLLAAVPMLLAPGCSSSPSAAKGGAEVKTNNVTGTVSTMLSTSLQSAYNASLRAADDMKYTTTKKALDAMKGVVTAKTADGTTIDITLENKGAELTALTVNAGPTKTDLATALVTKIQERTR